MMASASASVNCQAGLQLLGGGRVDVHFVGGEIDGQVFEDDFLFVLREGRATFHHLIHGDFPFRGAHGRRDDDIETVALGAGVLDQGFRFAIGQDNVLGAGKRGKGKEGKDRTH